VWEGAASVAVIPAVEKAAFVVGGECGKGVVTCKTCGECTAPAFLQLEGGSWGFSDRCGGGRFQSPAAAGSFMTALTGEIKPTATSDGR
jgi:hypothetical protein